MKKSMLLTAVLLVGVLASAQVKISREYIYPDLEVKFKRCVVTGTTGYIDLTFINHSNKEMNGVCLHNGYPVDGRSTSWTQAFDDEGNVYHWSKNSNNGTNGKIYSITFGGKTCSSGVYQPCIEMSMPSEVPIACRIEICDISEYATEFTHLKLVFLKASSQHAGAGTFTLRNIPITRRE